MVHISWLFPFLKTFSDTSSDEILVVRVLGTRLLVWVTLARICGYKMDRLVPGLIHVVA
jgi:hypothetical protein